LKQKLEVGTSEARGFENGIGFVEKEAEAFVTIVPNSFEATALLILSVHCYQQHRMI